MNKRLMYVISFSFLSLTLIVSFAEAKNLNLSDLSDRSFKNENYKLSFNIEQSEHGTKNTLKVNFECNGKKGAIVKESSSHEVCNIDYKDVKIFKTKNGFKAEYKPIMQVNWDGVYKGMSKGKDLKPRCIKDSKEKFEIKVSKCK